MVTLLAWAGLAMYFFPYFPFSYFIFPLMVGGLVLVPGFCLLCVWVVKIYRLVHGLDVVADLHIAGGNGGGVIPSTLIFIHF